MLGAVIQGCQDYYDQIPPDTLPKVAKSAVYTFTLTFLFSNKSKDVAYNNLAAPLFAAGAAALASVIYALTTPFFNMAFRDNRILAHREFAKGIVNLGLTSLALEYITTGKVNLGAMRIFASLSCNLILGGFEMIPTFLDWIGEPATAHDFREGLKHAGCDAVPGSSSVFINF
jgi:hypothetical protein